MKKALISLFAALIFFPGLAQEAETEKKFGISFSGFVKNDFMFDTRQTVAAREGHLLLWPAAESLDENGVDINEGLNFNFLAIQTRLKGTITGPDAFGAKTSGVIEGAFFGHSNSDVNGFRLRHAFGKLNWTSTELLFGQYWHPMFITGSFPGTVSFNTGLPFQAFSRNPQVRVTQKFGGANLIITAMSQRDFTSAGGSSVLRNSGTPEVHLQLTYNMKNESGFEVLAGAGAGYKSIRPRLVTGSNYEETSTVSSLSYQAFLKVKTSPLTFKAEGLVGQNTYDILGISSYAAVSEDPVTGVREYISTGSMGGWAEVHTNGKTFQAGLFAGYLKNTGAGETIVDGTVAGSRGNIDYVSRVSPRLIYNAGKVRFALELEMTTAAFGDIAADATVTNATSVTNFRTLLAAYYFF